MKIEVDVSDDKLQNLSASANAETRKVIKHYIEEVLDEASRLEESRRTSSSSPEITAAIINDAVVVAKTHGIRQRKTKMRRFTQIAASLSSIFTGSLFKPEKFNDTIYMISYLVVFAITVITTVYLTFNDNG